MDNTIINNHYSFTKEAAAHLASVENFSTQAPPVQVFPNIGDKVSFEALGTFWFVVIERRFHYVNQNEMEVHFLLDFDSKKNEGADLRLI
ncbi:MAG: hypothetical protein KC467_16190 [Marinomonas atlantica]|nr:hypothetical protein [Marinomonas atlantica]